jgi:ADP-ribosylglycohydrolase
MLSGMAERVDGTIALAGVADRAGGALLGTFVGDALAMPFEGRSPTSIPEEVEMVEARRGRGTYTDDTQMMIALAESLIARGRVDAEHLARAFLDAYDADRGYGGVHNVCLSCGAQAYQWPTPPTGSSMVGIARQWCGDADCAGCGLFSR